MTSPRGSTRAEYGNPPPIAFESILDPTESYIFHSPVDDSNDSTTISPTLILTTKGYYLIHTSNDTLLWKRSIQHVHCIELLSVEANPEMNGFMIVEHTQVSKNKVRSTTLDPFLETKTFKCDSEDTRDIWVTAFRAILRQYWQFYFESKYIAPPEVYQFHRFVTKTNAKGRSQIRCLALSTDRIYNIQAPEQVPLTPGKIKWFVKVSCVEKVAAVTNEPRTIIIHTNNLQKTRQQVRITFKDLAERDEFVLELSRIFHTVTGKLLDEELGKDTDDGKRLSRSLKSFYKATSQTHLV